MKSIFKENNEYTTLFSLLLTTFFFFCTSWLENCVYVYCLKEKELFFERCWRGFYDECGECRMWDDASKAKKKTITERRKKKRKRHTKILYMTFWRNHLLSGPIFAIQVCCGIHFVIIRQNLKLNDRDLALRLTQIIFSH